MSEIGNIIAKAAKEIETRGWCQGTLENDKGEVCALGAVHHVLVGRCNFWHRGYEQSDQRDAALKVLAAHIPADFESHFPRSSSRVVTYNNAKGRTKQDMLELFEKAALDEGVSL